MPYVRAALLALILVLCPADLAHAQEPAYSARAQVRSPKVLAMGDAGVALPSRQSVHFYNPAHLTHLGADLAPVTLIGARVAFSPNFADQRAFYNDRLEPALVEGLGAMPEAERLALYQDALALGQDRTFAGGTVLLPSFALNRGSYGVGGGLFVDGRLHYRIAEGSGEAPIVDFISRADFMAVGAGALDLGRFGFDGLSAGLTARYTQRYLTLKNEPLTNLDDDENLYALGSGALGLDLGLHYATRPSRAGQLHAGGALYDALGSDFSYPFRSYYAKNSAMDEATLRAEQALAEDRLRLRRSYRLGLAYTSPRLGPLEGFNLAADYLDEPGLTDDLDDRLRLGAELRLTPEVALRTGFSQGEASFGAGFAFSLLRLDYAYHYVAHDGLPGGFTHVVQLALGSF